MNHLKRSPAGRKPPQQLNAKSVRTPYRSRWNADAYERAGPFKESPFDLETNSTSGACVAVTKHGMVGALAPAPVTIAWDGEHLNIAGPADAVWSFEGPETEAWQTCHERLGLLPAPAAIHGRLPEYCTWVEQCRAGREQRVRPFQVLTDGFVRRYLEAVTRDAWPRGRFNIDEGWCPPARRGRVRRLAAPSRNGQGGLES